MADTMIERVGAALLRTVANGNFDDEAMARAAIEAMREPTAEMTCIAGGPTIEKYLGEDLNGDDICAEQVWKAMIDGALK